MSDIRCCRARWYERTSRGRSSLSQGVRGHWAGWMRQSNAVGGLWLREPTESETTAGARDHGGGLRSQPKQRWSAETIVQTWWSRSEERRVGRKRGAEE